MKKRFFAIFTLALVVFFWEEKSPNIKSPEKKTITEKSLRPDSQLKKVATYKYPSKPQRPIKRVPSAVDDSSQGPRPAELPFEVNIQDQPIKIGKSFNLVKDIVTIDKKSFSSGMGQFLNENNNFVFFRPNSEDVHAWPVALNRSTNKLFPVSHILHVKGVDSAKRDQFKAEGYKEFYYHPRMQFISLETTPSTVIKQYQELTSRGYEATLEVLKEPYRLK